MELIILPEDEFSQLCMFFCELFQAFAHRFPAYSSFLLLSVVTVQERRDNLDSHGLTYPPPMLTVFTSRLMVNTEVREGHRQAANTEKSIGQQCPYADKEFPFANQRGSATKYPSNISLYRAVSLRQPHEYSRWSLATDSVWREYGRIAPENQLPYPPPP